MSLFDRGDSISHVVDGLSEVSIDRRITRPEDNAALQAPVGLAAPDRRLAAVSAVSPAFDARHYHLLMSIELGSGWRALGQELERDLRLLDPPGVLRCTEIDASGLPRFRVSLDRRVRTEGKMLVRSYEGPAARLAKSVAAQDEFAPAQW